MCSAKQLGTQMATPWTNKFCNERLYPCQL